MDHPLNYIANMNSRGVECLASGRTAEAAQSFHQALRAMTSLTDESQPIASPPTSITTHNSDKNESMEVENEEESNQTQEQQGQIMSGGISLASKYAHFETAQDYLDEQDFLYQQGLFFDPNSLAALESFDVYSNASLCLSAVILYNLGLTCHQQSRSLRKERSLNKAVRLYEMAANVLMNENDNSLLEEESVPIVLAILNNKAHALYELGLYEDAEHTLGDIFELLQMSNQRPPSFQEGNINLLYLHSHLQQLTKHAPAA